MDIYSIIETLKEMDVANSAIRAALLKKGFEEDEIDEALPSKKRVCFANDYFDFLAEFPRSEEDAKSFINGEDGYNETSDNVKKYEKMHLNTWSLAQRIWDAKS